MCILLQYIYHDCGCLAKTGTYHCAQAKKNDREWSMECERFKKTEQVLRIGELTCDAHIGLILRQGTPELEFSGLGSGASTTSSGSAASTELGEGENGMIEMKRLKDKLKSIRDRREARREAERLKKEAEKKEAEMAKEAEGGEKGKGVEVVEVEFKHVEDAREVKGATEVEAKESNGSKAKEDTKDEESQMTAAGSLDEAFASDSSDSNGSDSSEMGYEGDTEEPVKKPAPPVPTAAEGSLTPRSFAASPSPRQASNPFTAEPTLTPRHSPNPFIAEPSLSPRAIAASLGPRPSSNPFSSGLRRVNGVESLTEAALPSPTKDSPPKDDAGKTT